MKGIRALIAAVILAAFFYQPFLPSNAQTAFYARAETRAAYFYSGKSQSSALFTIPYTYCVQVISEDGGWYYVKYAEDYGIYRALYGYCLKDDLTAVNGTPEVTYLYKEIEVTYTADASESSLPVLGGITVTAAFYGTYYSGPNAYSYVLCSGSFGYIEGANDDYELIDYETDNAADTDDTQTDGTAADGIAESSSDGGNKFIAAVILTLCAAAAVTLLLLTGARKKYN